MLELLLNKSVDGSWHFRRHFDVTMPIESLGGARDGVPYLAPEIVLLYKAKDPRERDGSDLEASLPHLHAEQRGWLSGAIARTHGPEDPWLRELNAAR